MNSDQELFYSDFVSSGLLSVTTLDYLVTESEPQPGLNPSGAVLEMVDNEVCIASLRIDPLESRSHVTVNFASCRFMVAIDVLRADLIRATCSPA